ncbi:MAG: gliding motility-associated C-terminal domain-containing protein [Chitinophagaceae bacterium]|nr:gliding motility-associated C-terminal domain-containing protein [Chitinophagaceae bacterium]
MRFIKYLALLFLFAKCFALKAQVITTVAGTGVIGYSGDGGPAINAQLGDMYYCYPAFDNAGNMYIAQSGSNTIRKIDINGVITTIAGTIGLSGYSGDGGLAINALLYHPNSIAIDNVNNIYFADANGSFIRKIDPAGIITTVSGQITPNCGVGDGGPLALARFRAISAMTFDQFNNLYIADYGCNTIRKVNPTGIITTIAGTGTSGYSGDGGPATSAQLDYPCNVAIDNFGNILIPDARNHRIRKVDNAGIITTIAGTGTLGYTGDGGLATLAQLAFPGSVVIDNLGNYYFGDYYGIVIRKVDQAGIISTYAGNGTVGYTGDGGPAILASLNITQGKISIDNNNFIYFADDIDGVIRKINDCITASISQQPANATICNSGNASFSVLASNAVGYLWQIDTGTGWTGLSNNGIYSGTNTSVLNITGANTSMNGYRYRCVVINNCANIFTMPAILNVTIPSVPTVTISSNSNPVCPNELAIFKATITNGGLAPIYQWEKNNTPVGINSSIYTDNSISNGDIINCTILSNATCISTPTATSNTITMALKQYPPVNLGPDTSICSGNSIVIKAQPGYISYLWQDGSINSSYTANTSGIYKVIVTDQCGVISTDSIIIKLNQMPAHFLNSDTIICVNSELTLFANKLFLQYLWNTNSISPSILIKNPGLYWLQVTDTNNCTGRDSILIRTKQCVSTIYFPNAFTPNGDGINDTYKPKVYGNILKYNIRILNRYGEVVFESTNILKGWDGKFKNKQQPSGCYVWFCSYNINGLIDETETGSFLLLK